MTNLPSGNAALWMMIGALVTLPVVAAQSGREGSGVRMIVEFDSFPPGLATAHTYLGHSVVAIDAASGFLVVEGAHPSDFARLARQQAHVKDVEADPVRTILGYTPNDPQFASSQYAPQMIGAPAAWTTTFGVGRTICLLDTGVRTSHQDLAGHYAGGIDLVNNDATPWDDNGHGTRTAGAAAAVIGNGVGVAGVSNAKILSVKVLDAGGVSYGSAIATGIRWCADHGANIVSMSFGGAGNDSATYDSVMYATGRNVLIVAAAGNGGCDNCVLYPGALDAVVGVGCVDQSRDPCSFTSRGPQIDLAAPGVNVETTTFDGDDSYGLGGGTSMSTPIVAGAAALVWSAHPDWSASQVRRTLESTAQDVGTAGRDTSTGLGLVRPDLALASAGGSTVPSTFAATFRPSSNSNEWWVEVSVTATSPVASVDVRADGGAWQSLPKTSWGTWAKSIHVPAGSNVEFRATDTQRRTAASSPQAWLGASPSFTASFSPRAQTNVWWVETGVTSSSTVAKVEARLNGGAWTDLPKTSWGTWAKSLHAPSGTHVEFRATSSTGATVTSAAYTWG